MQACTRLGPKSVVHDRFDYAAAIAESWKHQVLTTIVKARYHDLHDMLVVDQIVAAYTREHTASNRAEIKFGADSDLLELGYIYKYNERPTILYRPMSGVDFVKNMLTPAKPAVLFALDVKKVIPMAPDPDYPVRIDVHSGNERPEQSYVAIRYRDKWFWVDSTDSNSRRTFVYLSIAFNLTLAGKEAGGQVIVPIRERSEERDSAEVLINATGGQE